MPRLPRRRPPSPAVHPHRSRPAPIAHAPTLTPSGEARRFPVGEAEAGLRLDRFLAGAGGPELSRSRVQALIAEGHVTVDGLPAPSPKRKVSAGQSVALVLPEPADAEPAPEAIALDILFEDAHLIVLDKPAGLVVHPGAGNPAGTLVNALLAHCGATLSGIGGVRRPGIVHRLDKDTSGVMVAAKTDAAHRALSAQFAAHGRDGKLERAYRAIAWGVPPREAGVIDAPLARSESDRTRRRVAAPGRPDARVAVTRYRVVARATEGAASLVECRLETGRTHQIRVHMAHIGHPLIGDALYGAGFRTKARALPPEAAAIVEAFPRQALHAFRLGFEHPETGEAMRFEGRMPRDMAELQGALGL